jgi:hypothetical protein
VVAGVIVSGFYPLIEGVILRRFTLSEVLALPNAYILYSAGALAIAAIAWATVSLLRAKRMLIQLRNHRFGLRGEQAVADALASASLARAGYVSFHDMPGDGNWNIDHVVVGPGGVFVLETKARSKRTATWQQPEHEVWVNGTALRFPWCVDTKAIPQAERNAKWVHDFIAPFSERPARVTPIVVVPGWSIPPDPANNRSVQVINSVNLPKYIAACGNRYTEADLGGIIARLQERCRTLDF